MEELLTDTVTRPQRHLGPGGRGGYEHLLRPVPASTASNQHVHPKDLVHTSNTVELKAWQTKTVLGARSDSPEIQLHGDSLVDTICGHGQEAGAPERVFIPDCAFRNPILRTLSWLTKNRRTPPSGGPGRRRWAPAGGRLCGDVWVSDEKSTLATHRPRPRARPRPSKCGRLSGRSPRVEAKGLGPRGHQTPNQRGTEPAGHQVGFQGEPRTALDKRGTHQVRGVPTGAGRSELPLHHWQGLAQHQ